MNKKEYIVHKQSENAKDFIISNTLEIINNKNID